MFLFQTMAVIMSNEEKILEGQIRECYGRIVYTHKTHEKAADILLDKQSNIKKCQIILSAIIAGGMISMIFDFDCLKDYKKVSEFIAAIISTILLVLNSYTKDYDLGAIAQKHRQAGADLWVIREKYLSLLTDLRINRLSIQEMCKIRDSLMKELGAIQKNAPSTDSKAYNEAKQALKEKEELTFSDDEIDKLLPTNLRKNGEGN